MTTPRLSALLLAAIPLAACAGPDEQAAAPAPAPAIAAQVIEAAPEMVSRPLETIGNVEPWLRVAPGFKVLGRIETFQVREGDRVHAGQVLVRLERRDLEAAVAQAEAAITTATAQLENARAWHARIARLQERGSATDKSLEDAVAALRVAEAALAQAQAGHAAALVALEYAEVRASLDGTVAARYAEAGDMASPGMPLLTIEDASRVKVAAHVPEADLVGVAVGTPVQVRVDALELARDGRIDSIVPAGDPASRSFTVKVLLDNPGGALRSGMFARVLLPGAEESVLAVPQGALVLRGQLTGVWVVTQGVARIRWIRTGRLLDGRIEVLSGLEPGEHYLPEPPAGIADGVRVIGG